MHELEAEQERLSARTYELDAELRQTQNLLGQTALDLDRSENRITFNREQAAQLESRAMRLAVEIEQAERQACRSKYSHCFAQREVCRRAARANGVARSCPARIHRTAPLAVSLRQEQLEARIEELRQLAARLVEESAREQAESLQAEECRVAAHRSRRTTHGGAPLDGIGMLAALAERAQAASNAAFRAREQHAHRNWTRAVRDVASRSRSSFAARSRKRTSSSKIRAKRFPPNAPAALPSNRFLASAPTPPTPSRSFSTPMARVAERRFGSGFRAVGLLADYAEVQEQYEAAIEQFLRDELEYVVVESFDHARAGVALLREEMGGRATFFVDSLKQTESSDRRIG